MLSLLDLISQNQPHFQTHKALLIIGLQNDFIQSDGKLPVDTRNGFLDRIESIVPKFRQLSASVIWVRTLYEADRIANDPATEGDMVLVEQLDGLESSTDDDEDLPKDLTAATAPSRSSRHRRALELLKRVSARKRPATRTASPSPAEEEELFLSKASKKGPACVPGTPGAEFADKVRPQIEQSDTVVTTSHYSAFLGTQLLLILRAKLVTELYICGCITNVSIFATVVDAARHGIKIYVVEDCLGYRKQNRHDEAVKKMVDYIEANLITSREILSKENPQETYPSQPRPGHQKTRYDTRELEKMVDKMRLSEASPSDRANGSAPKGPPVVVNGGPRTVLHTSVADSKATTDTKLSDEQFMEKLSQGARISTDSQNRPSGPKPNMVKSKIRMRSRGDKSKKEQDKKLEVEATKKVEETNGKKVETISVKRGEATNSKKAEAPKKPGPLPSPTITVNNSKDTPVKSPKSAAPALETVTRQASITKAESSDKLRESPSKREQTLKASASQPALSTTGDDQKEKSSKSRLSFGRSWKIEASKSETLNQPEKAPTEATKPQPKEAPKEAAKSQPEKALPETLKATLIEQPKPAMSKKPQSLATLPTLRPGDRVAEGDSRIIYDFFPPEYYHPTHPSKPLKELIFHQLYNEVRWQKMYHVQGEVPRLVCCQGEFSADGSMPIYRHPSDQALPLLHFSPTVQVIRKQAEKLIGQPLNHVLVQLYRSGQDYISEHSDKTLDIVRGSSIVNISFGAQRTMRLRTKKSGSTKADDTPSSEPGAERSTQRVAMPHNSMFVLGPNSNTKWLHGINADKRLEAERSEEEKVFAGMRISLTFRHIGTFLDHEGSRIWGQGATEKDQKNANDVINDDEEETEKMVRAFSKENHDAEFDWEEVYGEGFDVLHFREPPEDVPILFASNNATETKMVQLFLWETKLKHLLYEVPTNDKEHELDRQVCFRDNDVNHTEVCIAVPILLYLDRYFPLDRDDRGRSCNAESYDLFITITGLLKYWVNRSVPTYYDDFVNAIDALEQKYAMGPGPFIAGRRFSIGDCAAWPALDEIISNWEEWSVDRFPRLTEYYMMVWKKKKCAQKLRSKLSEIRGTTVTPRMGE